MNITKATKRDSKLQKRRNRHIVDGKGVFTIQEIQRKRAEEIKKARKLKELVRSE